MRLSQLYDEAVHRLRRASIDEAEIEAAFLLCSCLDLTRTDLVLSRDRKVDDSRLSRFQAMLARRIAREPGSYITGHREFWSLDFAVNRDVLIPRPETEFLIETVLVTLRADPDAVTGMILDLCTGSGVIGVVLARELERCRVVAVDISVAALELAGENIRYHGVADRVRLVGSDLFGALKRTGGFQLIVTNPPYVAAEVIATLQPEVRDYEPRAALDGGRRGLRIIERIIVESGDYLRPGGWLFMEIGADQEEPVLGFFSAETVCSVFEEVAVIRDWAGRPRVLKARRL